MRLIGEKKKIFLVGVLLALIDLMIQVWSVAQNQGSKNQGFGWGLPFSLGWQGELRWLLIGVSIFGLLGIICWYRVSRGVGEKLGLSMIILGGIVNLIMRLIWGAVVDYLCLVGLSFNMADILITGGVLLVIKDSRKEK